MSDLNELNCTFSNGRLDKVQVECFTASYVGYNRVSTYKQGIKGFGMDAHCEAVARFMAGNCDLAAQFIEVESGRKDNRPSWS